MQRLSLLLFPETLEGVETLPQSAGPWGASVGPGRVVGTRGHPEVPPQEPTKGSTGLGTRREPSASAVIIGTGEPPGPFPAMGHSAPVGNPWASWRGQQGLRGQPSSPPSPAPCLLQTLPQRCCRMEKLGLVAIGALGLCFLLDPTKRLGFGTVPPSPTATPPVPSLPPAPSLPTAAPCVANSSVHNISGFEELPQHIKDFMRYRHCRSFRQLLDVPGKCGGPRGSSSISLLLAIKSSPANYERREVIRRTWGQQRTFEGAHIRRVFLLGVSPNARDARKLSWLLHLEQREHRDVLQWDFRDTFFNLTLKQVLFHAWLEEHCPGVHFVFNGDDDVFVNTDNVVRFMKTSRGSQHLMVGAVLINTGPIRDKGSKYYVPKQVIPSERYPPYCSGGGMLMSGYTARVIHRESQSIELVPIDDAYLGMCLEQAGLRPAPHDGVRIWGIYAPRNSDAFDPCYYRELLVVHRFVAYETAAMWQAIHEPQLSCGRKVSFF